MGPHFMRIFVKKIIPQISTATHSEANLNQSETIWNLKFLQFFSDYILKWMWSQAETNLKSEIPIWSLKSQSEPIWTNLKSEVLTLFQTTILKWIWKQYKSNTKSEKLTPQWRPVYPPLSRQLVSLLPSASPPPRRPVIWLHLASFSRSSSLPPWPSVWS